MPEPLLKHDDAPVTLDSLISALSTLREKYGDLPVAVWAGKADLTMGVAYLWDRDEDDPPKPLSYVVLDCEEWAAPEVALAADDD